jgi:hypothetical protein
LSCDELAGRDMSIARLTAHSHPEASNDTVFRQFKCQTRNFTPHSAQGKVVDLGRTSARAGGPRRSPRVVDFPSALANATLAAVVLLALVNGRPLNFGHSRKIAAEIRA